MSKKTHLSIPVDWVVLFLFGLVPLLWFRAPGFIISGDMLPPITFENYFDRFFAWNERLGGGTEALLHFSALFFYFIEAILNTIFKDIVMAQKAEFVFWFLMPGVSMYYLLSVLLKGEGRKWGRMIGVTFYMFNLYLEPVWQGLNIANLSSYVFVPFMLGLMIEGLERQRSFWIAALGMSVLTFFAAPIGSNPPMLLASVLPFLFYSLFFSIRHKVWKDFSALFRLIAFFVVVLSISILINLFWIIPFVDQVFINLASTSLEFTPDSALGWLKGLSKNTSLLNVAKMQGAWVWYEGFGEPYIPYAQIYKQNPFFVMLGFLLPVLVAISFTLHRKNPIAVLLGLFALTGVILGAGIHPPFGKLYAWMVEHVPFFYTVRSPWYKFTLLTCLGYAGLLAFLGQFISRHCSGFFRNRKFVKTALATTSLFLIMACQLVYAFPITLGKHFFTPSEREYMTHNFMEVPPYVKEGLHYLQQKKGTFRVLDVSPKKMQEYEWGNFGFNHPLTGFSLIPVFYKSMVNSPSLFPNDQIVKLFHQLIEEKDHLQFVNLLRSFNIQYVLFPSDLHWYDMKEFEKVAQVREFLEASQGLVFEKNFGLWDLYRLNVATGPMVESSPHPHFLIGDLTHLPLLPMTAKSAQKPFLFIDSLTKCLDFPMEIEKRLFLFNMNLEELAVSECEAQYRVGSMEAQVDLLHFSLQKEEEVEIWAKASGNDLSHISNIALNEKQLFIRDKQNLKGLFPQWIRLYQGNLPLGEHSLYIRGRSESGKMVDVVVVPKRIREEKLAWIQKLRQEKKILFEEIIFDLERERKAMPESPKDEKVYWSGDVSFENIASVELTQEHPGFYSLQYRKGMVFKFSKNVTEADPSVVVTFSNFKPFALSENPTFYMDYEIKDPLSCSAQFRFYLQAETKEGTSSFDVLMPAFPSIPLYNEISHRFPGKKSIKCVKLEMIFKHSFAKRRGYRRYPNSDVVIRKWSVGQPDKSNSETNILKVSSNPSTEVSFLKNSPVSYDVQLDPLNEAQGQFLVLNQAYHPQWQATDDRGNRLIHYQVNGWANGFVVEPAMGRNISIYFEEQKRVNLGYALSGTSFSLLLLALGLVGWIQRRKK